jgi:tRNA threonylcarbamoyladenosine biosynthesis protein TsaE
VSSFGFEDYLSRDGVVVIEWPERAGRYAPSEVLLIRLDHLGGNGRRIRFVPIGELAADTVRELKGTLAREWGDGDE